VKKKKKMNLVANSNLAAEICDPFTDDSSGNGGFMDDTVPQSCFARSCYARRSATLEGRWKDVPGASSGRNRGIRASVKTRPNITAFEKVEAVP